jgi:hypothetical protein
MTLHTANYAKFLKSISNRPVKKQEKEADRIEELLDDACDIALEAMVIHQHTVYSLYSVNGKYLSMYQFGAEKLLSGRHDSLRSGWKSTTGVVKSLNAIEPDGAYKVYNSKKWADVGGTRYELPLDCWPTDVLSAKSALIANGNYLIPA